MRLLAFDMSDDDTLDGLFKRLCAMEAPLNERLRIFSDALKDAEPRYAYAYDTLVNRLKTARSGSSAPGVGDVMPSFVLPDGDGRMHDLDEYLAKGPVVVSFNRGHWCPYCQVELNALKQGLNQLASAGACVVSIMPEVPEYVARVAADMGKAFDVLSDRNNGYALSLDLVIWIGDELNDLLRSDRIALNVFQQNDAAFLPIPATFVVAQDRRISGCFVDPDFRKRMDIEEMLLALRKGDS